MSKLSIIEEVGRISGADEPKENPFLTRGEAYRKWRFSGRKSNKDYVRLDRSCLGENIAKGRVEDFINNPNPLG